RPDVPAELPIILIGIGPVSRLRLIAALRAGASDLWGLPMDSEELVLRLEALVRLKSAAECAREEGLLDWATGLYNRRRLTLRARDPASQADRRGAPRVGTRRGRAIARAAAPPRCEHPRRLRAGYHAVRDFHRAALGPLDLLTRATSALRAVQAGHAGGWIRGFKISPGD